MSDTPAAPRARKIGDLHSKTCRMAEQFDVTLQPLFDVPGCEGVTDQLLLVGRDGEVIRLQISADRLTGAEREAALAKGGRRA